MGIDRLRTYVTLVLAEAREEEEEDEELDEFCGAGSIAIGTAPLGTKVEQPPKPRLGGRRKRVRRRR